MGTEYIPLRDVRFVVSNWDAVSHGRFYLLVADSLPAGVKVANDDATCKMVEADPDTRRPPRPLVTPPSPQPSVH